MGLLEFLFERNNPGKVGSIERNNQNNKHISIPVLIIKLIISSLIVCVLLYGIVLNNFNLINLLAFIIILFLYCFISYRFIPKPDMSNVGLFGGLIDNPFRYTDDMNRMLIVLSALLYPGRFIATTFIQTIMLFKKDRKK